MPARSQSVRCLLRTARKASEVRSPMPVRIRPGTKKSGKAPCIIPTGICMRCPSGAIARRMPPSIPPRPSKARIIRSSSRFIPTVLPRYKILSVICIMLRKIASDSICFTLSLLKGCVDFGHAKYH